MYEVPYYFFYDSLMFIAMCVTFFFAEKAKEKKDKYTLQSLGYGYLSFILPSMFFSTYDGHGGADSNLPSVMCGFAVIFATFLTFRTLSYNNKRNLNK
jgi:FtsH-binding integral membrane protein